jgi:transposase-like protein
VVKRRVRRYSDEFKRQCVERMKQCDDIGALAKELGIHRRMLYRWRDQLDPAAKGQGSAPPNSPEAKLRQEVSRLKQALADKTLELDFFKGALQKVAARRQQQEVTGAPASTTKSGE